MRRPVFLIIILAIISLLITLWVISRDKSTASSGKTLAGASFQRFQISDSVTKFGAIMPNGQDYRFYNPTEKQLQVYSTAKKRIIWQSEKISQDLSQVAWSPNSFAAFISYQETIGDEVGERWREVNSLGKLDNLLPAETKDVGWWDSTRAYYLKSAVRSQGAELVFFDPNAGEIKARQTLRLGTSLDKIFIAPDRQSAAGVSYGEGDEKDLMIITKLTSKTWTASKTIYLGPREVVWSTDSRYLATLTEVSDGIDVWVYEANSGQRKALQTKTYNPGIVSWFNNQTLLAAEPNTVGLTNNNGDSLLAYNINENNNPAVMIKSQEGFIVNYLTKVSGNKLVFASDNGLYYLTLKE